MKFEKFLSSSTVSPWSLQERVKKLKEIWTAYPQLSYILVSDQNHFLAEMTPLSDNWRYLLTGFSGSAGLLLVRKFEGEDPAEPVMWLTVDGRYTLQFQNEVDLKWVESLPVIQSHWHTLCEYLKTKSTCQIGYVAERLSPGQFSLLQSTPHHLVSITVDWGSSDAYVQDEPIMEIVGLPTGQSNWTRLRHLYSQNEQRSLEGCLFGPLDESAWFLGWRSFFHPYSSGIPVWAFSTGSLTYVYCEKTYPILVTQWKHSPDGEEEIHLFHNMSEWIQAIRNSGVRRIAYHPSSLSQAILERLQHACSHVEWHATVVFDIARETKTKSEQTLIYLDYEKKSKAFSRFLSWVKQQKLGTFSEKSLSEDLVRFFRQEGALAFSFPPIIGFGLHSAIVHHNTLDETVIDRSGLLLVDCGLYTHHGFATDCTRTIWIGDTPPPQSIREAYTAVLESSLLPFVKMWPLDLHSAELDRLMRDVLIERGWPSFAHGTGHSLGVHVHERGVGIGHRTLTFRHHALTSVEPGIYHSDWGGIRLENIALVHRDEQALRFENLYRIPYDQDLILWDRLSDAVKRYLSEY